MLETKDGLFEQLPAYIQSSKPVIKDASPVKPQRPPTLAGFVVVHDTYTDSVVRPNLVSREKFKSV